MGKLTREERIRLYGSMVLQGAEQSTHEPDDATKHLQGIADRPKRMVEQFASALSLKPRAEQERELEGK